MSNLVLTKLPGFTEHLAEGVHDLSNATLILGFSNTAPSSETTPPASSTAACVLGSITQIDYTNLSSRTLATNTTTVPGNALLISQPITLTASGSVPTFRYVYVVNDSSIAPAEALLGYYDLGPGGVTLAASDTITFNFSTDEGLLSIGDPTQLFSIYYGSWVAQTHGWESMFAIDWWAD